MMMLNTFSEAFGITSLGKCLFQSFALLNNRLFAFFLLIHGNSLYSGCEFLSGRCKTERHLTEIISCAGIVSDLAYFLRKENSLVLVWIVILPVQKRDNVL